MDLRRRILASEGPPRRRGWRPKAAHVGPDRSRSPARRPRASRAPRGSRRATRASGRRRGRALVADRRHRRADRAVERGGRQGRAPERRRRRAGTHLPPTTSGPLNLRGVRSSRSSTSAGRRQPRRDGRTTPGCERLERGGRQGGQRGHDARPSPAPAGCPRESRVYAAPLADQDSTGVPVTGRVTMSSTRRRQLAAISHRVPGRPDAVRLAGGAGRSRRPAALMADGWPAEECRQVHSVPERSLARVRCREVGDLRLLADGEDTVAQLVGHPTWVLTSGDFGGTVA